MKKKILSVALMFGLLLLMPPNASADYPEHLNGDPDYVLTFGRQGVGYYVQKSSLSVEQYSPPIYILSVKVYHVNNADRGNTLPGQPTIRRFRYKWNEREMYLDAGKDWNYLDPKRYSSNVAVGEMAFYIAYKEKFYGQLGGFNDGFYSPAD